MRRWPALLAVVAVGLVAGLSATAQTTQEPATIATVAGSGVDGYDGDGGPATGAAIDHPRGIAVLPDGGFVFAAPFLPALRRVGTDGRITTVAGMRNRRLLRRRWPGDCCPAQSRPRSGVASGRKHGARGYEQPPHPAGGAERAPSRPSPARGRSASRATAARRSRRRSRRRGASPRSRTARSSSPTRATIACDDLAGGHHHDRCRQRDGRVPRATVGLHSGAAQPPVLRLAASRKRRLPDRRRRQLADSPRRRGRHDHDRRPGGRVQLPARCRCAA